jgi:hypothetical protein
VKIASAFDRPESSILVIVAVQVIVSPKQTGLTNLKFNPVAGHIRLSHFYVMLPEFQMTMGKQGFHI